MREENGCSYSKILTRLLFGLCHLCLESVRNVDLRYNYEKNLSSIPSLSLERRVKLWGLFASLDTIMGAKLLLMLNITN